MTWIFDNGLSLISVLVSGGMFAYLIAINKNKTDVRLAKSDLKAISEHISGDIRKIEAKASKEIEAYESNAQADMTKYIIENIISSLPNAKRAIDQQLSKKIKEDLDIIETFNIYNKKQ